MNEIGRKFLLAGDKFMAKMHLRQQRFAYNACVPNKIRIKGLKKQEICYQNELNKACFQIVMAYGDFKVLPKRTA